MSSSLAWFIACLWMSVHALCAADYLNTIRLLSLSGAHPSVLVAAVSRRRHSARLSILSAATTLAARRFRPVSTAGPCLPLEVLVALVLLDVIAVLVLLEVCRLGNNLTPALPLMPRTRR